MQSHTPASKGEHQSRRQAHYILTQHCNAKYVNCPVTSSRDTAINNKVFAHLDCIEDMLNVERVKCLRIDGSTPIVVCLFTDYA